MTKLNHFDMAREIVRQADANASPDKMLSEMRRMFPRATAADYARVRDIGLDRIEMLEEERTLGRSLAT
jgi:hypothetical protein